MPCLLRALHRLRSIVLLRWGRHRLSTKLTSAGNILFNLLITLVQSSRENYLAVSTQLTYHSALASASCAPLYPRDACLTQMKTVARLSIGTSGRPRTFEAIDTDSPVGRDISALKAHCISARQQTCPTLYYQYHRKMRTSCSSVPTPLEEVALALSI